MFNFVVVGRFHLRIFRTVSTDYLSSINCRKKIFKNAKEKLNNITKISLPITITVRAERQQQQYLILINDNLFTVYFYKIFKISQNDDTHIFEAGKSFGRLN